MSKKAIGAIVQNLPKPDEMFVLYATLLSPRNVRIIVSKKEISLVVG